jgi:hypothetical protein
VGKFEKDLIEKFLPFCGCFLLRNGKFSAAASRKNLQLCTVLDNFENSSWHFESLK